MGAWSAWASSAPLTYVRNGKRPKTRSKCRVDSAGIADCDDFAQVIGRGNRNMGMKKISEIITAGQRQYFRDPPLKRWTKTRTAQRRFERAIQCDPNCTDALRELRLMNMRKEKEKKGLFGKMFS